MFKKILLKVIAPIVIDLIRDELTKKTEKDVDAIKRGEEALKRIIRSEINKDK